MSKVGKYLVLSLMAIVATVVFTGCKLNIAKNSGGTKNTEDTAQTSGSDTKSADNTQSAKYENVVRIIDVKDEKDALEQSTVYYFGVVDKGMIKAGDMVSVVYGGKPYDTYKGQQIVPYSVKSIELETPNPEQWFNIKYTAADTVKKGDRVRIVMDSKNTFAPGNGYCFAK